MRCTDLAQSLIKSGWHQASQKCECSRKGCSNTFPLLEGFAFPGRAQGSDDVHLFFWCSPTCYLEAMPAEACWSC